MMPDNTLWAFVSLITSGVALEVVGAWLLHISRPRAGGRVLFAGCFAFGCGALIFLSSLPGIH